MSKHYGKKLALNNFSYTFENGIYALLGPNGAGKSTLMNIIAGVMQADADSKLLFDKKTPREIGNAYKSAIGYMPQQQALIEEFTAIQFMSYIAGLKGIGKKEAKQQIERLLRDVELTENARKKIGGFSGGMKQRLLFAQALLGSLQILILDEPTAGLDPRQRVILREMIERYAVDKTVIISTHIVSDVEVSANKIIIIKSGEIIESGELDTLLDANAADNLETLYMKLFNEGKV